MKLDIIAEERVFSIHIFCSVQCLGEDKGGTLMKVTINGTVYEAEQGQTILDVARANGVNIPTLCHLAGLTPVGACRVCVVEVEGMRTLVTACTSPVTEGMSVQTHSRTSTGCPSLYCGTAGIMSSPRLYDLRKNRGLCAAKPGLRVRGEGSGFEGEKHNYPVDSSNPFIVRDYNKCILCQRCVRACDEIQGIEAIKNINRGFETKIATAYDGALQDSNCVFCGQCVQVCPVGALVPKKSLGKGRPWEIEKVRTTCPYCGVGCQLNLHTKGEQIVSVTAVEDGSPNKGRLCVKGRFGYDFIYSEDRLTTPLIKENGAFREATWDEALDLVATKFKQIISESGPDAIAGVSCARSINEDSYQMQKLFRAVIGTNNIDHCART